MTIWQLFTAQEVSILHFPALWRAIVHHKREAVTACRGHRIAALWPDYKAEHHDTTARTDLIGIGPYAACRSSGI